MKPLDDFIIGRLRGRRRSNSQWTLAFAGLRESRDGSELNRQAPHQLYQVAGALVSPLARFHYVATGKNRPIG
ncbi:hypothetical protein SBC2_73190 (plasmid) [Caballeronia sp. SBC2]|nr:hypothetical protein SBC2_73190 [Caballeronia sp. SBC2]